MAFHSAVEVTGVAKMSATKQRVFWKRGVAAYSGVVNEPMPAPAVGEAVNVEVKAGHVVSWVAVGE